MAVTYALDYSRRAREREVQTSRLKAQLAEARLHALKMQLHPHFLFNTFNTIAMLVRQGRSEEAVEMIAGLGTLLRYVLEHAGEQEVSLAEELEFLQSYLDIEQIRFERGLDVRMDIAPETLKAHVPSLLLQPLVENAIRHGIEPSGRKGRLEVAARSEGGQLHIQMRDSGDGLSSDWELRRKAGRGLTVTKERLDMLYGVAQHFSLSGAPDGGAEVNVIIPHRIGPSLPSAA